MLKVVTNSTQTLERVLNQIKSVNGVKMTKTIVILSTVKNEYSVDPEEILK